MPVDPVLLDTLTEYLVTELTDEGAPISKIRIVKLLYLIDLEHYRRLRRTLTGLNWIYHHYGPYAFEIEGALKRRRIELGEEVFVTKDGYEGTTYRRYGDPPDLAEAGLSFVAEVCINRAIKCWALEELSTILTFIYQESGPMHDARKGEPLDFSKEPTADELYREREYLALSPEATAKIKAMIAVQRRRVPATARAVYDAEYLEAMRTLDEEEHSPTVRPGTVIHISPDAAAHMTRAAQEQ